MKPIQRVFLGGLLALAGLWFLADTLLPQPLNYFSFRDAFIQLTGILAIGAMSAGMLLAARPKWLEPRLRGLDKMYRLHKWLGITALVTSVLHWWFAQGTRWMIGWGWLERPVRDGAGSDVELSGLAAWLDAQWHLAHTVGRWTFYVAAALMVLALVKVFPYHWFRKTHTWLTAAYLLLVFHGIVLAKLSYWSQPVGWATALLMAAGTVSALIVLAKRGSNRHRVAGRIEALTYYPESRVLETTIRLEDGWRGHAAGQFAFVTSDRREGAHPYTIASAWDASDARLVFMTKELGDHTRRLPEQLEVGDTVSVEGPYGSFDFRDGRPQQIWVGAGIGITPFIARMKELAKQPGQQVIDLFHSTSDISDAALGKLKADARAANIRLHLLIGGRDGRLNAERLLAAVPQWQRASVWFCGPNGFGQSLREDLVAAGLSANDFHQELFEMR